jgi:hypothetical protein
MGQPQFWRRWRYAFMAIFTAGLLMFSSLAIAKSVGRFRVEAGPVENPAYQELRTLVRQSKLYEMMAEGLNESLILPHDLKISPATCGESNAFYQPTDRRIVMCDELLTHFAELFAPTAKSEEDLGISMLYTNLFVFFHELGHGLIDIYDLPTVGREEDAVDEFSTLLLLELGEDGIKAVLKAAEWFHLQSAQTDGNLAFWDEHSLDQQRFYGVACLMYGKDPKQFSDLVTEGILPESRAARCPSEYNKKYKSWNQLLAPYSRT